MKSIEMLEQRLKEAEEALSYYAIKCNWLRSATHDTAREISSGDCYQALGYARHCGGKRAKEYFEKYREAQG